MSCTHHLLHLPCFCVLFFRGHTWNILRSFLPSLSLHIKGGFQRTAVRRRTGYATVPPRQGGGLPATDPRTEDPAMPISTVKGVASRTFPISSVCFLSGSKAESPASRGLPSNSHPDIFAGYDSTASIRLAHAMARRSLPSVELAEPAATVLKAACRFPTRGCGRNIPSQLNLN